MNGSDDHGPPLAGPLRGLWRRFLGQPLARLVGVSLAFAAAAASSLMAWALYEAAWDDAWREIREKHQLLAQNLASPIAIYMDGQRARLALLARLLREAPTPGDPDRAEALLRAAQAAGGGWHSVSLLDARGRLLAGTDPAARRGQTVRLADDECLERVRAGAPQCLSGVQPDPFRRGPSALLLVPVEETGAGRVLMASLSLAPIEALRRRIRFGERGHSAIVDQHGRVVAHPNPAWMAEMRDISSWPVVQAMMAGRTGVTTFYSPFVGAEMVAGYASVPGIGWGVMVPQPLDEVARDVRALVRPVLVGGALGVLLVTLAGVALARRIARPLHELANALAQAGREGGPAPPPPPSPRAAAPREVRELARAFQRLSEDLRAERERHERLRRELEARVEAATRELREANAKLTRLARQDHLTSLANRRHFEAALEHAVGRRATDTTPLCLVLLDVDRFKEINDVHGHAAGDAVLRELAGLLRRHTRGEDLVARYGGDEFAILMRCDARAGEARAREILRAVARHRFAWQGEPLSVTVSMGVAAWEGDGHPYDPEELLRRADRAMYEAKAAGRNTLRMAAP